MCHQSQKFISDIFIGIPQHQKRYLIYVPGTRKIVSSYDVLFEEEICSALEYMSRPYSVTIDMWPSVLYIPYATSYHEQTGDIITFPQFEEGG